MLRALAALLVLTLFGCAHGGVVPRSARAGDRNAKVALQVLTFASGRGCDMRTLQCSNVLWRNTPWYRMEDMSEPDYVVLSGDGTACPIFRLLVETPQEQRPWACEGQWRTRR
jgi:hypothetical protein